MLAGNGTRGMLRDAPKSQPRLAVRFHFPHGEPNEGLPMAAPTSRPDPRDDYRVIRWTEWYQSKGLSKWAANRLRKSGKGPRVVRLTEHAIGVTVKDDREWTEARTREGV